jgi:AhpD family alkylhydroperoxidase
MENLDDKTSSLIGIGVAYAINCKHCVEYHKELAIKAGASNGEMRSAIAMGEKVRNGAHNHAKEFAKDVFG